jgi:uncharacterized iron-regulated protein
MSLLLSALVLAPFQNEVDPNRLPIGRKGEQTVAVGEVTDLAKGRPATAKDVAEAARGKRFVFLGENHGNTAHQEMEADVIQALLDDGREVVVGLEMYTRPKQDWLDQWSQGKLSEADFLAKSDWKGQWGFDYGFYRPVFEVARKSKVPMVALNVPRDWVRVVGREGYAALTTEQRLQLPANLGEPAPDHKSVFNALMGGHPMAGPRGDNMYSAQVLWDQGMADTAVKYLERMPTSPKTVFVVIAGSGHVMYGQGINGRIEKQKAGKGVTLVMIQSPESTKVSKGLADFVYVTKPVKG